ncbi:phage major capsid protein [Actinocatenispora sera]|uniref:phage major capsid protein n=1 Tax=Actinocatenispora sera TaxID=390989 RepID=UPI0033EC9290
MPTSVELRQQRARVVESLRALTDTAETAGRDLTAEERQSWDRHDTEFRELTGRIERQESLEQREAEQSRSLSDRRSGDTDGSQGAAGGGTAEQRTAQRRSAFWAFMRRGRGGISPEQRALVENTAGEILVPEELEAEIIRSLPKLTVVRGLASSRTINSDRVRRRSLDEVEVGWGKLETGSTAAESMPDTPTEEYTYVEDLLGLAKIGEDELDDSDQNLEAFVSDSFARAVGEAEDTGYTVGTGHANKQPVGFMTAGGGVPTVAGTAGLYADPGQAALLDDLKKLIYAVPAQYRRNGVFLMASSTELFVSTLKDKNGQYLWQSSNQAGRPNTLNGFALYNQEDIAAIAASKSIAAFGDVNSAYRIYDRRGLTVQRLVELYAEEGMVGFKLRRRVTGDVVRPDAMRILATPAA